MPDDDLMIGIKNDIAAAPTFSRKSLTTRATFPEPSMPMWTAAISRSALSSSRVSAISSGADRLNPLHPGRGLDGQSRDAGHAVAAVGGDGLDVRRHPCPGRGVKSGNGENHGRRLGHKGKCNSFRCRRERPRSCGGAIHVGTATLAAAGTAHAFEQPMPRQAVDHASERSCQPAARAGRSRPHRGKTLSQNITSGQTEVMSVTH